MPSIPKLVGNFLEELRELLFLQNHDPTTMALW